MERTKTDLAEWQITIKRTVEGRFEASLPFRQIVFDAPTEQEAVSSLVKCYAGLARTGEFNPENPQAEGVPPIQHVLSILGDMLQRRIDERDGNRRFTYENDMRRDDELGTKDSRPGCLPDGSPTWGSAYAKGHVFTRDNEVISGLATAIAALARVKEL